MEQIAYKVITDRIIERLEAGVIPWKKPWNGGGCPRNLISKIEYRGINPFILGSVGYAHRDFLTFRQVTSLNGHVKKGEKALPVLYWNFSEKTDKDSGEKVKIPFLKYYNVFNVEQCKGIDEHLEKLTDNPDKEPLKACSDVVDGYLSRETTLKLEHSENRAYYSPSKDLVMMPEFKRFNSKEEYHSTLFHELVHSTGHVSRLDRGISKSSPFGSTDYSKEELIAELGCAFLCGLTGIEPQTLDNSTAYIQGWLKALRADAKILVQAGGKAQRAVDYILKGKSEPE